MQLFREMLVQLNGLELAATNHTGTPPRKTVGVYVGWRGLTQQSWVVKQLTFWGRKRTAHEVGRGGVTELLVRLEHLAKSHHRQDSDTTNCSRFIIIGHSFGGAVLYSALAPLLIERLIEPHGGNATNHAVRGFGDLVVLINPAFEAARFQLVKEVATDCCKEGAPINFTIFSSEGDSANKGLFPIGRCLSTFLQAHQSTTQRVANITAVGHYQPFWTHILASPEKHSPKHQKRDYDQRSPVNVEQAARVKQLRSTVQAAPRVVTSDLQFTNAVLKPLTSTFTPLMVIRVKKELIEDHNNINRELFVPFLTEFVNVFAHDENHDHNHENHEHGHP